MLQPFNFSCQIILLGCLIVKLHESLTAEVCVVGVKEVVQLADQTRLRYDVFTVLHRSDTSWNKLRLELLDTFSQ